MSQYYPAILQLKGKRVVVVGGGKVAERKIIGLLERTTDANISVVSPTITPLIREWAEAGKLIWKEKFFEAADIYGALLVFAATNKRETNLLVQRSLEENQLINIADNFEESSFVVPATFSRGKLLMTVSTGGASPFLSKKIKEELQSSYDESYENYLDFLYDSRMYIKSLTIDQENKRKILKRLLDPQLLELTKAGDIKGRTIMLQYLLNDFKRRD